MAAEEGALIEVAALVAVAGDSRAVVADPAGDKAANQHPAVLPHR